MKIFQYKANPPFQSLTPAPTPDKGAPVSRMKRPQVRYYIYADESGQQSCGEYFVVAAAVLRDPDQAREAFHAIEASAGRVGRKWSRSTLMQKQSFLGLVSSLLTKTGPAYYRVYSGGTNYLDWTLDVIAAAAQANDPAGEYYVMIDGLDEAAVARKGLRQRGMNAAKVRGGRDESEALLRFADFVAGVVGEHARGKPYLAAFWPSLSKKLHPL